MALVFVPIAFGSPIVLAIAGLTLHWWLGRRERARRELERSQNPAAGSR